MVGLDAALLTDSGRPNTAMVREVAGGCICCSASFMFDVSLVLLLQRRPDRLLIELTGLATLSGILDTLARPGIREAVDVRSVICLLDPARLYRDVQRDEVIDQIDAADVILANRPDLASIDHLEAFDAWAQDVFPPKRYVGRIERGEIPLQLLDLVSERGVMAQRPNGHRHLHDEPPPATNVSKDGHATEAVECDASRPIVRLDHRSSVASTVGWVCWRGLIFDSTRSIQWLKDIAARPGVRRVKAVLRTDEGWWSFNAADGAHEVRSIGFRGDSRLELIVEPDSLPELQALEHSLRACLVS